MFLQKIYSWNPFINSLLKTPSAICGFLWNLQSRPLFQSGENNPFFPVTSSSGPVTVYMNNYCVWFNTNANPRDQRQQTSSNLWLHNPNGDETWVWCRSKQSIRTCAKAPKLLCKRTLVRKILYFSFKNMFICWRETNLIDWRGSKKQNPVHWVVSSGALQSTNPALMDKRFLRRAISIVIATKRNKSYATAVQKHTHLIPTTAKIGLMLDWNSVAFKSPRQQHFETC